MLSMGAIEPAPSPAGSTMEFASRGWIWLLDETSQTAKRRDRLVRGRTIGPGLPAFQGADRLPSGGWIGAREAAGDLFRALETSTARLRAGYAGAPMPNLEARFQRARQFLEAQSR